MVLFAASFVGLYLFALGVGAGVSADRSALASRAGGQLGLQSELNGLLDTISLTSLALAALGTLALALMRRRVDLAVAVLVLLIGANASTQVIKDALMALDPLALEGERLHAGAFPSGHATAAASVGLAALLVVGSELRRVTALVAVAYAVAVGVATVALGWHYPSDVVGGFLVAGAWAAAVGGVLGLRAAGPWISRSTVIPRVGALALGALALSLVVLGLDRLWTSTGFLHDNTSFIVAVAAILTAGALVVAAVASQLDTGVDL